MESLYRRRIDLHNQIKSAEQASNWSIVFKLKMELSEVEKQIKEIE